MSNFTLFLMAQVLGFLWAATVRPLASRPPVTKTRIQYIAVDYDYDEETPQPSQNTSLLRLTTAHFPPRECDYDPCVVQSVPCSVLSAQTKCYCPGLTGQDQPPEPPRLLEVKQGSSGEVEVYWCAPFSTVKHYKVVTEDGKSIGPRFGEFSRNGTLQDLKTGTKVCVVAINNAGSSERSERSCARYEPQNTNQVALQTGIIAGSIGFLVLLSLAALIIWRRKSYRKSGTSEEKGLGNPSYSANETL